MKPVSVRETRKTLASLFAAKAPTLVGNEWTMKALIIPIRQDSKYDSRDRAKALVVAQGEANEAFRALRKGFE